MSDRKIKGFGANMYAHGAGAALKVESLDETLKTMIFDGTVLETIRKHGETDEEFRKRLKIHDDHVDELIVEKQQGECGFDFRAELEKL